MWFKAKAYCKFIIASKNRHGIHSPFVYQLLTDCIYDKKAHESYKKIGCFREYLLKKMPPGHKPPSLMKSKLLNRLVRYFEPVNAIEHSHTSGMVAVAMQVGNGTQVHSPIADQKKSRFIERGMARNAIGHIHFIQSSFDKACDAFSGQKIDFAFIGKNIQANTLTGHFKQLLGSVSETGIIIFDDIHRSPQTESDWEAIKANPLVGVTIDLFFWGMVFFKTDQEKQDFKIRV